MSTAGTAGAMSSPSRANGDREGLPRALGREEDRQPAVGDLGRQLDRPPAAARRGRSGSRRAGGAASASAACPGRSRPARCTGRCNARPRTRASRGAAPSRTTSTYSRVFASGLPHGSPCQPSTTCGPEVPSPSRKRPPDIRSSVAAVMAVFAGVRAGIWRIAEPILIVDVVAREPREHGDGVRPPGLRGPRGVVAEPLGLLRERDQLGRVRPGRGVAHVEAEAHGVRC